MARPSTISVDDENCQRILALLQSRPGARMGDISKELGMYHQLAARRLNVLAEHDLVHPRGVNRFTQWYAGPRPLEGRAKGVPDMFLGVSCIFRAGQNLAKLQEAA